MAPVVKTVTGTISRTNGEPWPFANIIFTRAPHSFTPDAHLPSEKIYTATNKLGYFSQVLWANEEGQLATSYICTLPDKESFIFSLPVLGPDEYTLSELQSMSVVPVPDDTATLLQYINDRLGEITGTSVTADLVPLRPLITGLGGTVQSATEIQNQRSLDLAPFYLSFSQSDLSVAGVLPVTHNKGTLFPQVMVWNNEGEEINEDGVLIQGSNAAGIQLGTYTPITGTWLLKLEK